MGPGICILGFAYEQENVRIHYSRHMFSKREHVSILIAWLFCTTENRGTKCSEVLKLYGAHFDQNWDHISSDEK